MRKTSAILTALMLCTATFDSLAVSAVNDYILGDSNKDGMVNASDATEVLKYYSELSTGGNVWANDKTKLADMDGDGMVDSSDASYILSYYSVASTGGNITPERFMEYRTKGFGEFIYYNSIDVRAGKGKITIKASDISSDENLKKKYPEGIESFAYDVKIYKCKASDDETQGKELLIEETVRNIKKGERIYKYFAEEYHESCDIFEANLPDNIDTSGAYSYQVEVRGHYLIGGVEAIASNTSTAWIEMIPLIVNNTQLNSHDTYKLYNIKVSPPEYKAEYYVSEADKKILDDFAKEHFTEDMSNYDKIEYTWDWLNKNVTYASGALYMDIISDSWVSACFIKKKGQCLQYNGALAEMMVYMGFDVYMLEMWLNQDGTNQHFRAEVVIDGQAYSIEVGNNGSYAGWMWLFRPIESSIKELKVME